MSTKSVQKLKLLEKLWEDGFPPNTKWKSEYDQKANELLYDLLGIRKDDCSNSTIDNIDKEVTLFQKRVNYHWGKCGRKKPAMVKRDYFTEKITIEVIPISRELNPHPSPASGSYKSFEEKGKSVKALLVAEVLQNAEPGAILAAAPRAASLLDKPVLATALRKVIGGQEDLAKLALEGMKNESKQMYLYFQLQKPIIVGCVCR